MLTVITDDLTGAADSGSYFTARGCRLKILTGQETPPLCAAQDAREEIVSINLSSRNTDGQEAKRRHYNLCSRLPRRDGQLFMKKIGTGFRGNDAFELEGMLEAMPDYLCFLVAHAPDLGTFTLYGNQYCEGEILHKSLYANDPIFPPTGANIPEILARDTDMKIGLVDIDAVKGGNLAGAVQRTVDDGCRIIVFDAITDADTLHILKTLAPKWKKVFWTGSLGIAGGLAQYLYGDPQPAQQQARNMRNLCFCASAYEAAKRQIAFSEQRGLQVVRLDMDAILDGADGLEEQAAQDAANMLRANDVLLMPQVTRYSMQPQASKAILRAMERCAGMLCETAAFDRLIVIGGETAQRVFSAMQIHTLQLQPMPEPGVARGVICDGPLAGKEFALKGGSLGDEQTLERMRHTDGSKGD